MGKSTYSLVARDKDNNSSKIIDIEGVCEGCTSLDVIDSFTSKFNSRGVLIYYLLSNGLINSFDTDLYIVSKNGKNINYLEIIYGMSNPTFNRIVKDKNRGRDTSRDSCIILDQFSDNMFYDTDYRKFVFYGLTSIYKKFVDYYRRGSNPETLKNNKYKDGSWAIDSYPLIRNIIESYTRYNIYNVSQLDVMLGYFNRIRDERDLSLENISTQLDQIYMRGQSSLFDKEEEVVDKMSIIDNFLGNIGYDFFAQKNGSIVFNDRIFKKVEDDYYRRLLRDLLDDGVRDLIYKYLKSRHDLDYNVSYDIVKLSDEVNKNKGNIIKALNGDLELLNKTYYFVLLYNKCCKDNKYGGNYGGYQKRKDIK